MRIPVAPPTVRAALPTAQPELLPPARAHTALPAQVRIALAQPAHPPPVPPRQAHPPLVHPRPVLGRMALPRLALPPPAPTELAPLVPPRQVPPRQALPPPARPRPARARMVLPRLALPLPAPTELVPPVHPPPAPTELAPPVPPRVALLPLVHRRPAQVRMALPRLALPPLVHPQPVLAHMAHPLLAPAAGAHPVRLLPPELPRAARMVRLLATAPLAAPPLLPRATTAWVSTSLRVTPFPRGSLLIRTSRLPARVAISSPRQTRSKRTLAATRRAWIMWISSPVISTRFPTASTILSKPQVVRAAVAPTVLRRVRPSNRNPLLRAAGSLRRSPTVRGTPMASLRTGTITIFSALRTGRTLPTWITARPTLTVRRAAPMSLSARALVVARPAWALRDRTSALVPSAAAIQAV